MELTNDFLVPLPVARAWTVLNDVERMAGCLPGITLDSVSGLECRGTVRIKIGPVTTDYAGTATFVWRDEVAGRVVVET
ncbi:MAG: SRPBCC domain-containing protein, partial [Acidimicrobiales bacterium]|nr:SRPBCC domain-containing protein [Acidimicrobiales bacterium]